MTGRIQEVGKGSAIHRQTRVLTRRACCDQLVAIHIQTHMRPHTFSLSVCLSFSLSLPLSLIRSLTCIFFFFFTRAGKMHFMHTHRSIQWVMWDSSTKSNYQLGTPYPLKTPLFSRIFFDTQSLWLPDICFHITSKNSYYYLVRWLLMYCCNCLKEKWIFR